MTPATLDERLTAMEERLGALEVLVRTELDRLFEHVCKAVGEART